MILYTKNQPFMCANEIKNICIYSDITLLISEELNKNIFS